MRNNNNKIRPSFKSWRSDFSSTYEVINKLGNTVGRMNGHYDFFHEVEEALGNEDVNGEKGIVDSWTVEVDPTVGISMSIDTYNELVFVCPGIQAYIVSEDRNEWAETVTVQFKLMSDGKNPMKIGRFINKSKLNDSIKQGLMKDLSACGGKKQTLIISISERISDFIYCSEGKFESCYGWDGCSHYATLWSWIQGSRLAIIHDSMGKWLGRLWLRLNPQGQWWVDMRESIVGKQHYCAGQPGVVLYKELMKRYGNNSPVYAGMFNGYSDFNHCSINNVEDYIDTLCMRVDDVAPLYSGDIMSSLRHLYLVEEFQSEQVNLVIAKLFSNSWAVARRFGYLINQGDNSDLLLDVEIKCRIDVIEKDGELVANFNDYEYYNGEYDQYEDFSTGQDR